MADDSPHIHSHVRPSRWRRRLVWFLAASLALLAAAEMFARFYLGLGDPPLSVADPQIEYLFAPSRTYRRFGNVIRYNAWSMRSDEVAARKVDPAELRVLVLGDSVINGGSATDQADLATTLLQQQLHQRLARPVFVGNVSAGSWGPTNLLAYVRKFGLFDADVVVLVLSSHDYSDASKFEPVVGVNPDFPDRTPILALQELVWRYLPRYLPSARHAAYPIPTADDPADIERSLDALRQLIALARQGGARVIIAQHMENGEWAQPKSGHAAIAAVAAEAGITPIQLGPAFEEATRAGRVLYRTRVHPNAAGQKIIADVLRPVIEQAAAELAHMGATTRPADRAE